MLSLFLVILLFNVHGKGENEFEVELSNGVKFPLIGFGTAGKLNEQPIRWALDAGYKLIDTAQATEWYNENEVGKALTKNERENIFIISKLHPRDFGKKSTREMVKKSLQLLQTNYLDGFLLHYKRCWGDLCKDKQPTGNWKQSWRVMERMYKKGILKSIGVSNFQLADLKELWEYSKVKPHFIQNWHDPLHQDKSILEFCKENGILFQAYSSLGTQWRATVNPVLNHDLISKIAESRKKTVAQIVLRWQIYRGIAVIPRSSKKERIETNLDLDFELSENQLAVLDSLDGTYDPNAPQKPQQKNSKNRRNLPERKRSTKTRTQNNTSIQMKLHNHSEKQIEVFWDKEPQGSIQAGESVGIETFDKHLWKIFVDGKLIKQFRALLAEGTEKEIIITNSDIQKVLGNKKDEL